MVNQRAVILILSGVLLLMLGVLGGALGLGASVVPPDWEVENTKTIYFAYSTDLERIYDADGRPTSDFDFPIDQSRLPIPLPLGEHTFQIDQTRQDRTSDLLELSESGQTYELALLRSTRRTYPANLPDGKRLYITSAEIPDRSGELKRVTGEPFLGFRSVTVSLASPKQMAGLQYAIMGLGVLLVVAGVVVRGKTGKGLSASAVLALTVIFMVGPYTFTIDSINTDLGTPTTVNMRVRDLISGDNLIWNLGVSSTFPLDDGVYEFEVDNIGGFGGEFYRWSDGETDNPRIVFVGSVSENTPPRPPTSYVNSGVSTDWTYTGSPAGSALYADDGDYAYGAKSKLDYWGGFSYPVLPDNATISGIEVTLKDTYGQVGKTNNLRVALSWDNRVSFTTNKTTLEIFENAAPGETFVIGSSSDTWGRTWTGTEIKNSLWARVTSAWNSGAGGDTYLDYLTITVHAAVIGSFGETFEALYSFAPPPPVAPSGIPTGGPAPPSPIFPRDGELVEKNDFVFDWQEVRGAWYYEVWIDEEPTFDDPVVILSFPHEARVLLSNGDYYWRSRTYSSVGSWSRTHTFRVSEPGGIGTPLDEIPPLVAVDSARDPIIYTESSAAAEGILKPYAGIFLAVGALFAALGTIWLLVSRGT